MLHRAAIKNNISLLKQLLSVPGNDTMAIAILLVKFNLNSMDS